MPLTQDQLAQRKAIIDTNKSIIQTNRVTGGQAGIAPLTTDVRSVTTTENPLPGLQNPPKPNLSSMDISTAMKFAPAINTGNGTNGGVTSPNGSSLTGTGNIPSVTPTSMTTQDQAKQLVQGNFSQSILDKQKLFGTENQGLVYDENNQVINTPTMEQYLQYQDRKAKEQVNFLESQNQAANKNDQYNFERSASGALAGLAGTTANLAGGRNGVQSVGNMTAIGEYSTTLNKDLDQQRANLNAAIAQRDNNLKLAQQARAEGQLKTAEFYDGLVASAEQQIQQTNNATLALQNAQTQLALDVNKQQFEQGFKMLDTLITNGVQISPMQAISLAKDMGVATEDVLAYNDAIKQISDDKRLTIEQKSQLIENAKIDLERKKTGRDDENVRRIDTIKQMYSDGIDQKYIDAYMQASGMDPTESPKYKAQLSVLQSQAIIEGKKARGETVIVAEQDAHLKAQAELREYLGENNGAILPSNSLEDISVSYENGQLKVDCPAGANFQCGKFVNRAWGLSSGSVENGGMGSLYSEKKAQVDKRGIVARDGMDLSLIRPGMAFVMPTKWKEGHTGLVATMPDANGDFRTIEYNADPNKPANSETRYETTRNISEVYGFVPPPKGVSVGSKASSFENISNIAFEFFNATPTEKTAMLKKLPADQQSILKSMDNGDYSKILGSDVVYTDTIIGLNSGKSVAEQNKRALQIAEKVNNGDTKGVSQLLNTSLVESLDADGKKNFRGFNTLLTQLDAIENLQKEATGLGIKGGTLEKISNSIGKTSDPAKAALKARIDNAIMGFRQAVSGAAFTESEAKAYEAQFPGIGKDKELNDILIEQLRLGTKLKRDSIVSTQTGGRFQTYDELQDPKLKSKKTPDNPSGKGFSQSIAGGISTNQMTDDEVINKHTAPTFTFGTITYQ